MIVEGMNLQPRKCLPSLQYISNELVFIICRNIMFGFVEIYSQLITEGLLSFLLILC